MRKLVAAGAMALGIAMLPLTAAHAGSTWIVTVKASDTAVNAGQKVTFTGTVKPHGAAARGEGRAAGALQAGREVEGPEEGRPSTAGASTRSRTGPARTPSTPTAW